MCERGHGRGGEREQGSENGAGTVRGARGGRGEISSSSPSSSSFRCIIGPSTVIFPHRLPTAEENMIYRGQHHKQQHSLTNTQWQPRPHADTLPHYKSREVAGWEKKKRERGREREREGWTESQADRERCRGRQELMGERWRRISKCFLKYKQPSANIALLLSLSLSPVCRLRGCTASTYKQWLMMMGGG